MIRSNEYELLIEQLKVLANQMKGILEKMEKQGEHDGLTRDAIRTDISIVIKTIWQVH